MIIKDKVVLITGSSRGIGAETAILASNEGAKIIINFRLNEKQARKVADEIKKNGGEAIIIKADVAKLVEVKNMVKADETGGKRFKERREASQHVGLFFTTLAQVLPESFV